MTLGYIDARSGYDTRHKTLKIGGTDVLTVYADSTTHYSVDIDSIDVSVEGAGSVSSMTFRIWDPLMEFRSETHANVEFWDWDNGRPEFLGFIQSIAIQPAAVGRWVAVTAIGVECLLDWMLVPAITIRAGTLPVPAIQSLVANATGVGWPIRAFALTQDVGQATAYGTQACPMAGALFGTPVGADVVIEGQSLREAIQLVTEATDVFNLGLAATVTIDFWSGLRVQSKYVYQGQVTNYQHDDYGSLVAQNTVGSGYAATSSLNMNIDSEGVAAGVYVKRAAPAQSGLYMRGDGFPGRIAFIDATQPDAGHAPFSPAGYLTEFGVEARGSASFEPMRSADLAAYVPPGALIVFLQDAQTFADAQTYFPIASIRKTYEAGGTVVNWTVAFGGPMPSLVKQVRRATRAVRN